MAVSDAPIWTPLTNSLDEMRIQSKMATYDLILKVKFDTISDTTIARYLGYTQSNT